MPRGGLTGATVTVTLELMVIAEFPPGLLVSATDLDVMVTSGEFGCATGGALEKTFKPSMGVSVPQGVGFEGVVVGVMGQAPRLHVTPRLAVSPETVAV